jgi:hypothetical protein
MASRTDASERVAIELSLEPESAARARAAISSLRPYADASSLDEVRLLVTELLADALATEPRPENATVKLEARAEAGVTRVTVTFDGLCLRLPAKKPQPAERGWGVYLVQTLATSWGARRTDASTHVWFEA